MTDWMPWAFVVMAGTFATIWFLLKAIQETPAGERPDLGRARRAFLATVVLSALVYTLYLVAGEGWLWYG